MAELTDSLFPIPRARYTGGMPHVGHRKVVYFDGREMVGTLPQAAIDDCSTPGQDATESVKYWVQRLSFDAPPDLTREYLTGFGAWDEQELADHHENVQRLLWVICGYLREDYDYPIYLES